MPATWQGVVMKTVFGFFAAGMLLVSSLVFAGTAILDDPAVSIDFFEDENGVVLDRGLAYGQMWSARSSKNDFEYIGCSYKAIELGDGSVFKFGFCQARDVNEVRVICYTDNPEMLDAMQATSSFAWARFRFTEPDPDFFYHPELRPEGARHCTRFDFSTQSYHLPEFTTKGNQESGF
jgi:hypothetical protein